MNKTIWLSQQGNLDLQLTIGFICTRVKNLDYNDWKKLICEMKYLQYTKHLPLIPCAGGKGIGI